MNTSCFALIAQIDWSMVSALSASLGVIVALIFHMHNLANTRLSNSATMVLNLADRFDSSEMRGFRVDLARSLLADPAAIDLQRNVPVIEFFEEVGYMTRRGVLDKGMVWNSFSWYLEPYFQAITTDTNLIEIARSRSSWSTLYRETEWLYKTMCVISKKEEGTGHYVRPSRESINAFLHDESHLDSPISDRTQSSNANPYSPTPEKIAAGHACPEPPATKNGGRT